MDNEILGRIVLAIENGFAAIERRLYKVDASLLNILNEYSELRAARIELRKTCELLGSQLTTETSNRKDADYNSDKIVDVLETRVNRLRDSVLELERKSEIPPPSAEIPPPPAIPKI